MRKKMKNKQFYTIDELVHQDMVTDLEGVQHRPGWNLESLDDEGSDKKGQDHRHQNRFNILPEGALLFYWRSLGCRIFGFQTLHCPLL